MSSGQSLTRRQRRGFSVVPYQNFPPPAIQISDVNVGAGTIQWELPAGCVIDPNPANWSGWGMEGPATSGVSAVTFDDPTHVTITMVAAVALGDNLIHWKYDRCILGPDGAAVAPFVVQVNVNGKWPPGEP